MVKPLNTARNRKLQLLDFTGEVLQLKHGIIYFKLSSGESVWYLKCEKGFFDTNFSSGQLPEEGMVEKWSKFIFEDYSTLKTNN